MDVNVNEIVNEVKELMQNIAELVERAARTTGQEDIGEIVRYELAEFLMYLSASDGELKQEEADLIGNLCDIPLTPAAMSRIIEERNTYSVEFENRVPRTFELMVKIDNELLKIGLGDERVLDGLLMLYRTAGQLLMEADHDVDENEKADLEIYMNVLTNYVNQNSDRRNTSVAAPKKNGSVIAPKKDGSVIAPKKG